MRTVSVVIPTCDRPDRLARALASVAAQTRRADEIIVVDNGRKAIATDALPAGVIVERLAPRIGASRARNAGLERAQGDYVAFLDDDDLWEADYLARIGDAVARADTPPDLLIGRRDVVVGGRQQVYKCVRDAAELWPQLLVRNPGAGGSNMVASRMAALEVGGFDGELIASNDRDFALKFVLAKKIIACVPDAVAIIDRGDDPRLTNTSAAIEGKRRFLRKYRPLMSRRQRMEIHSEIFSLIARKRRILKPFSKAFRQFSKMI